MYNIDIVAYFSTNLVCPLTSQLRVELQIFSYEWHLSATRFLIII